jgi:hypothetical protein
MLFVPEAQAAGTNYYVAPNGSGSSCTRQSPCSFATGLSKAMAGDEVVLLDGVYQGLRTKRSGSAGAPIVIRAENRHKAVIQWPHGGHGSGRNVSIEHDNIVLRDLKIDGKKVSWDNLRIGASNPAENIIIEGNWIVNSGHAHVGMFGVKNVVFRHNLMEDSGYSSEDGEGFYLSSANHNWPVVNVEIYGNVIRNVTANFIDYKGQARNVNVHHNIFDGHRKFSNSLLGDGLIRSAGSNSAAGNYFQDNIVRNAPDVRYNIRLSSNRVDVLDNVFSNIGGSSFINSKTTGSAVIKGNTLCNSSTGGDRGGNRVNQPMSTCQSEEQRILNEIAQLPGKASGTSTNIKPPSNLNFVDTSN